MVLKTKELQKAEERASFLEKELRKARAMEGKYAGGLIEDPQVIPFFKDEVRGVLIETLKEKLKNVSSGSYTRKRMVLEKVLEENEYDSSKREELIERLKNAFNGYRNMTGAMRLELQKMGFSITEEGKHYKLFIEGDEGGISVTLPKTSGDSRAGKNIFSDIKSTFF